MRKLIFGYFLENIYVFWEKYVTGVLLVMVDLIIRTCPTSHRSYKKIILIINFTPN